MDLQSLIVAGVMGLWVVFNVVRMAQARVAWSSMATSSLVVLAIGTAALVWLGADGVVRAAGDGAQYARGVVAARQPERAPEQGPVLLATRIPAAPGAMAIPQHADRPCGGASAARQVCAEAARACADS